MSKRWASLAGALAFALVTATGAAQAATLAYHATLNGASEVPPVRTAATGTASVEVDTSTKLLGWFIEFSGLSSPGTAAQIHCGAGPGANAGMSIGLTYPGIAGGFASPNLGTATSPLTDAQLDDLKAGRCYINIQTTTHPDGEIRGQLTP
jgi:hypothetical protein